MKTTDIRHSWQLLTVLLFQTDALHLTINCTPNNVYEGQSVTLCCTSDGRPATIDVWWDQKNVILSSKQHTNLLCHKIVNASRYNSGGYRCYAQYEFGIVTAEVKLKVLYPLNIPDQHRNFSDSDVSRTLPCLAHGVPVNYTYGQWKHVSYFGEHIRYLYSTADGRVTLPHISKRIDRYQDSGIYICSASNGVVDSTGKHFQDGKIFVIANGPPIFVENIEDKQYGQPGKDINLEFIVYTQSMIICYNVKSANNDIAASMKITSVNGTIIFHGTEITVEAIQVVLSFKISNNSNSHLYTVTLCNGYGNNSFEVEIEIVTIEENISHGTKVASIIILIILVMCVSVLVAAVFLTRKRNTRRNASRATEGITEFADGYPIPLNHAPEKGLHNVKRSGKTSYSHVWC